MSKQPSSRSPQRERSNGGDDRVKGGYQPTKSSGDGPTSTPPSKR
ncbi:hypothetical protein R7Q39_07710 [Vibrio sp. 947]|nr:hypothetical protein [Vibrio sp. 947]MDW1925306.1 hypothetical protein [Vibrio sp. 947]